MQKSPKWWLYKIRTVLFVIQSLWNLNVYSLYRKQCINETEEFDFLKDIVANVDDATHTNTLTAPVSEENKPTISIEEVVPHNDTLEKEENGEDKGQQNHKCSISTMLNDEPVTPLHVRSKSNTLTNQDTSPERAFDQSSEQVK